MAVSSQAVDSIAGAQSVNSVVHLEDSGDDEAQLVASSDKSVLQEVAISESIDSSEVLPDSSFEKVECRVIDNHDLSRTEPACEPSFAEHSRKEPGFDLKDCKSPVVIEIFCGSARVTASLRTLGLSSSFGVDHVKVNSQGPIKIADLTTKKGQKLLLKWLESPLVQGVFLAPPCGTCSLARNIKIRDSKGRVMPGPVPLRSQQFPEGLTGLSHTNRLRVSKANKLYEFVGEIIRAAHARNLIIVVENPRSSLFWLTRWWRSRGVPLFYVAHQACAYGSSRPKWTVLAANHKVFRKICRTCPGESPNHKHLPWGVVRDQSGTRFATSEETAYPHPLAAEIALCFAEALKEKGWIPPAETHSSDQIASLVKCRATTGIQPKSSKLPPLVREHKAIIVVRGPHEALNRCAIKPMERIKKPLAIESQCKLSPVSPGPNEIPSESQLLRFTPLRSRGGEFSYNQHNHFEQAWGVPYKPNEFVAEAVKAGHPQHIKNLIPKILSRAIERNIELSSHAICVDRVEWFKKWLARSKELHQSEIELKRSIDPDVAKIIEPKRILLWKEMLLCANYPDMGVVDEVLSGTELVGEVGITGIFESRFKPADITVSELKQSAYSESRAMFNSARSSGDDEIDLAVLEKTQEEVQSGWAHGPIPFEELPPHAILSRRFGLKQPGKIRLIDDLSGSLVNATVQTNESPKPHTTDMVAALSLELLRSGHKEVLGRAYDLKAAYKQLAISPNSKWASFIVIFNPKTRKPEIYQLRAVPFGATRSVFSFLRVAHSIWFLGTSELNIMWSNFYDDFIAFSPETTVKSTHLAIETLFDLLGWKFAREGDKANDFSKMFSALGIQVNLTKFDQGIVEFANTPKRIEELVQTIETFLKTKR